MHFSLPVIKNIIILFRHSVLRSSSDFTSHSLASFSICSSPCLPAFSICIPPLLFLSKSITPSSVKPTSSYLFLLALLIYFSSSSFFIYRSLSCVCARMCARSQDLIFRTRFHFCYTCIFLFTGKLAFHPSAFRTKDLLVSMKTRTERRSTLLTQATVPQALCVQCLAAYNCKISRHKYTRLSVDY
jgi:hypothetical protein